MSTGEEAVTVSSPTGTPVSVDKLSRFVIRCALAVLDENGEGSEESLRAAITQGSETLKTFITDPLQRTLILKTDEVDEESKPGGVMYSFGLSVSYSGKGSIVFIKLGGIIEEDKPISGQVCMLNFSQDAPLEALHGYMKDAVAPFFNSYVHASGRAERDGDKLVPAVQQKFNELEVSLRHLQQNIDIPEVQLVVNPEVMEVVKKATAENKKPSVASFGTRVTDSNFLNTLQKDVNRWKTDIQKVTSLDRDPTSGDALQEISFWLNLEYALSRIQNRRESPEIALTMDILKAGKRFQAVVGFDTDTQLKEVTEKVKDYCNLMKDFPLNDLLAASSLEGIKNAIAAIFMHMKKMRNTEYPPARAVNLLEAISKDVLSQMTKVLGTHRLLLVTYEEFEQTMARSFEVFTSWDEEYDKLAGQLREVARRRRDEMIKIGYRIGAQRQLQERLTNLKEFRRQHEQLYSVITRVLVSGGGGVDATTPGGESPIIDEHFLQKEIVLAYENVKVIDCLDLSQEGIAAWEAALKRYDERIDVVETRIAAHLRDQLGTAKKANEMFRIFSRYNALFVRPHIQGAIREYQTQLIQRVKEDIDGLHQKFKGQYAKSSAFRMSTVRDIPPVAGSIIWAKQIDRQLTTYLQRVEAVLGKGWENHVEGQKLKADGDAFRQKLNTQPLFEEWKKKVESQPAVQGRIFSIVVRKARTGEVRKLQVNFQSDVIQLSKEVRNLRWMGFRVPLLLVNKANQANQLYPHAVSLMESVRTYELTCEKIVANEQVAPLVSSAKRDCQTAIQEGMQLEWSSFRLENYVRKFADVVFGFQERVDEAILHNEELEKEISLLSTCDYSKDTYSQILERIQKTVDDLNLHSYSNLQQWVAQLDSRVEEELVKRLGDAITLWTASLTSYSHDSAGTLVIDDSAARGDRPRLEPVQLELRITNQVMYLNPPVEMARSKLIDQFHFWVSVITGLPRIQSSRYQVGLSGSDESASTTYSSLLGKLMQKDTQYLMNAFSTIDKVIGDVSAYVKVWLQYQSLWDMEQGTIYGHLGEDLGKWQQLLHEIKKSRSTFDNTEIKKVFGPVIVHYGYVQKKVNDKYDTWHKEVLTKFGGMLGQNMQDFYSSVSKARTDLENHSVDAATTSEAVSFITLLQGLKRNLRTWEQNVEVFKSGQKILDRQRFQYPPNWLYADNVDSEWSSFTEILKRKDSAMQSQVATLQGKIMAEDKAMEQRAVDLLNEWEKGKPIQGNLRPDDALGKLQIFEGKFARLKEERDNVVKAREALELEAGGSSLTHDRVLAGAEELQDLKGVWTELGKIWQKIDEMKEKPWITIAPRKIRQELEALIEQMKLMPNNLKTYSSYDYVLKLIRGYLKVNILVTELKSEALKDRHWKDLMKKLRVRWVMSDLTLGQIWDVDLQRNEAVVRDIILVAQGEMGLEVFLRQVREYWNGYELEMVNYQNKCRLIKGWDDLFNKCKEHINQVAAMKLSPYFKVFEEEAIAWEDKLNRINALFDVWIDVQRRWVYLEGIFEGSTDIRHLLPTETQKFQSISTEFVSLMRRVAKSAQVMEVLGIPQVQKLLERLSDLLTKIQKALGEYLEKERAAFPRFYFVGDEDLMEIIGNSKNVARLQKHFKKMFAGVSSVILNEENSQVLGVMSREGEEALFKKPVDIVDRRINEWLKSVEEHIRITLAEQLAHSVEDSKAFNVESPDRDKYLQWLDKYQAQVVDLTVQITWTANFELALTQAKGQDVSPLERVLRIVNGTMNVLADSVLQEQPFLRRKKLEHLITELVHQRDMTRSLIRDRVTDPKRFEWLSQMRLYFDPKQSNVQRQLTISMANANFFYGFEYLGVQEKLVQTPLTDRLYLTMTQALKERLGGSPFGPAGTGKTESVKALGNQLGRFVLVFNCDERFDFQAMGRIFVGLCQVGAWGCFDEFNRLEERMLSAVSQQIQAIQEALKEQAHQTSEGILDKPITVDLLGRLVKVNTDTGIFITMNPGYAGRSNLPDNLKQLFRSLAMTKPDRQLIAEVMLYSQGFRTAEVMSSKAVPFFNLCNEQLSNQSHYDFGLRALKSVLVSAGNVKRNRILNIKEVKKERGETLDEASIAEQLPEQEILIQSICETMVPKLVAEDIPLLYSLLSDVFPGIAHTRNEMTKLRTEVVKVCNQMHLVHGSGDEIGNMWLEKVLQLYQIADLNHGLMMVGPSGSGKSTAWRILLKALENLEGIEGVAHVIDPKAITKEELYGVLDPNTREWTDGIFTHILRKIIDNVRGEIHKRQWIIFDGDVDPEWVENLNSVLDDNKLLTLPNGERLSLPPNVRIMFEVQNLKYATLATVSRCGMVWFSEEVLTSEMIFENFLNSLRHTSIDEGEEYAHSRGKSDVLSPEMQVQKDVADIISSHFASGGLVMKALEYAEGLDHIMEFTKLRVLNALFSMIHQTIRNVFRYNQTHPDFPMEPDQLDRYASRNLIYCLLWSFTGDSKLKSRQDLGNFIRNVTTISLPSASTIPIIDYEVNIQGEWITWQSTVPKIEVETHKVGSPDVVVPTLDTVRHESLLNTWLAEHKPMVLCGPPGSGKTMTLLAALRLLPDFEVIGLNFSSATTPELLLKTFEQYCEFRKTPNGMVMSPIQIGKWLVFFCDEINLPNLDKYGTQRVISFMRQIVEHGGFYRTSDRTWIKLERVQFVGACNPPTDPGRKPLSQRFLRHVPVVYVDYPGHQSLMQIYGTFNRAMLRLVPSLRTYADPLTEAMVDFYLMSQERFTQDMQPHYVYSPRELTRWVKGIYEAVKPCETLSIEGLVRIWAHEALRLFQDRLIYDEERSWTDDHINSVALKYFPSIDRQAALGRPILFSDWLTRDYLPVNREELREYVQARLKVFYEEELDVPLVLFDEVLEHVLRIDRIFKQHQGHLLLIGVSGSGKTTLSRFVAWINGLSIVQVKVHNKYTSADFDDDLRTVLRRTGCKDEKVVFIMDESNVLDSSFLERINTLLANGEVPGLFEGDELTTLMTQCKEASQKVGLMLDSSEELYKWFTQQVMKNLHVVFTMNPSTEGLKDRASTSPALFNRCVLNWFGDWSTNAFYQVGMEFTSKLDIDRSDYILPDFFPTVYPDLPSTPSHRQAIVNAFVYVHQTMHQANLKLAKRGGNGITVSPRNYLDFISHYVKLYNEKRSDLEEQQLHLNVGLQKIQDTVEQVEELQASLSIKKIELEKKNALANQKLKQMVHDQQEAEKKKATSQEIQEALHVQTQQIAEKKEVVLTDLSKVEPAVKDAQKAVQDIKKQHLVEVKNFPNPPKLVKLAMESICMLLGEPTTDWRAIRGIVMRENFISSIVNFQTEEMSDEHRKRMREEYLSDPQYNYEAVNRASRACGPLVKWAIAQVSYSDMLNKVEPLRNELSQLETDAEETRIKGEEIEKVIVQLEKSIALYKEEYAKLISEANAIKTDLEKVETKVTRSKALLSSLAEEQERWKSGSEIFKSQMSTIVGDVLLTSAFIAYAGYFDQHLRKTLYASWTQHLKQANVSFRSDLARLEYLSTADERLQWQKNALPADDLCVENAIMLKRFNRYPLIIDPSGQATEFLLNEYKDKKIMKTSFLDDAFRKNLESALRFGTPLLVQDVESYDPILNPVLNREVRRTGGRVLITLGDQDIDLSPSFTVFLSTRDPTAAFPPDLCSRVTFVNFTVTRSSLQSQCLHQVLKAERPDVDEKRSDLMKLQGEYLLRLRHLEKSLLSALNEVKGRILDNDDIISQLENLKKEAGEVSRKMEETDIVMAEVERVSQEYVPLAASCSSIYFTIEGLSQVHFLYQFSLKFFLDVYLYVLNGNPKLKGIVDHKKRLQTITKELFQTVYNRVAHGMLHDDRIVLALLLSRIYLKIDTKERDYNEEFEYLLRGKDALRTGDQQRNYPGLSSEQVASMCHLAESVRSFVGLKDFASGKQDFINWLNETTPERNVPTCWRGDNIGDAGIALYKLLVIQAFRPDRLTAMMNIFVSTIMGETFMQHCEQELNLASIVEEEIESKTPVILASVVGFDASGRVDDLAAQLSKQCTAVAMGSVEGFTLAEKAISSASKTGRWVMLKNVHLAPQWLVQMEKRLHSITPHSAFRLFLTMEINPRVPVNLLRVSRIVTFEPPPGVKANLLRTFSTVSSSRMSREPAERSKMYFILAWLHAIIQERLHYVPLGWAKKYEFNESDLKMSCDTLDTWLDMAAQGRSNVPPEKIPWNALCTLLSQCIYGGRIDNDFDQKLLNNFVHQLFSSRSFSPNFALMKDVEELPGRQISIPEGIKREDFLQWIDALPDTQTPSWLGLPATAQKVMLQSKGTSVIAKLLKMQMLSDDDEVVVSLEGDQGKKSLTGSEGRPSWMVTLLATTQKWISILPQKLTLLRRTADSLKDPMFRFFEREISSGVKLLKIVCRDLLDVVKVCEGKMKQTNYLRSLINDLVKGIIPEPWKCYTVPPGLTVLQWVTDFSKRIEQLQQVSALADKGGIKALRSANVWLGGLFSPEAYVTASRQHVAQENKWSLEELQLKVYVGSDKPVDQYSFGILGLRAVGANIKGYKAALTSEVAVDLPVALLTWSRMTSQVKESTSKVTLPFYLSQTRSELLFTADFDTDTSNFYERGVAVVCSTL